MLNNIYLQRLPDRMYQECPLCGQWQPMMMRGIVNDIENGELNIAHDKGYSFCNCHNIFFTDIKNMEPALYDADYYGKYKKDTQKIALSEAQKFFCIFKKFKPDIKSFFEIGAVNDIVLDYMKSEGLSVSGIDLVNEKSTCNVTVGDFEKTNVSGSFDVVWASHVFEHFTDLPLSLQKVCGLTAEGGLVYVAMPDTYFINWSNRNPYQWDWNVQEHYILWGMDSFIEYAKDFGLTCLFAERGTDLFEKENGQWFWKQDFKAVFKNENSNSNLALQE